MHSKNKTSFFRNDFFYGILSKWYKFLPLAVFSLVFCISMYTTAKFLSEFYDASINLSTIDYILNLFKGKEVYVPSPDNPFIIPVMWLIPNLYISFIIANYPTNDLSGVGKNILLQSKSRTKWYLNKCLWGVTSVLICYIMIYIAPICFSIVNGNFSFKVTNNDMVAGLLEADYSKANETLLILHVIILPVLTSIAISLFQILLEFLLKPIYSYTVIAVVLIASVYFYTPILIGNLPIMLRSDFVIDNGINLWIGIAINVFVIAMSVIIGCIYFNKRDILEKE